MHVVTNPGDLRHGLLTCGLPIQNLSEQPHDVIAGLLYVSQDRHENCRIDQNARVVPHLKQTLSQRLVR